MRFCTRFMAAVLLVICTAATGHTIPQLLNYQGTLTDGGGPVSVPTSVEFRIWNDSEFGAQLWTETQMVTPDSDGRFAVLLGAVNPIPDTALAGTEAYLGVTIAPDPEMSPRSRLVAAAYAFRVGTTEGAVAGEMSGNLILKPDGGFAHRMQQDPGDPSIILVSTQGDSIYVGPADQVLFRAVDDVEGEYMIALDDDVKGPIFGLRVDGTQYVEHAVAASTYYEGDGVSKDIATFTKKMEVGRDGAFVYGATDTDTLSKLDQTGLRVRDNSGNFAEVKATTAEFKNSSGETTAKIGEEGIQVFSTGGAANRGPQAVDTIFSFDPVTSSLRIGIDNVASGQNSIAVGTNNSSAGANSVTIGSGNSVSPINGVAFGQNNTVTSIGGAIGGGTSNVAAFYAVVAGGRFNEVTGSGSTISGGEYNEVDNNNGAISGGRRNYAAFVGSIGGGEYNFVQGDSSTIAGGAADSIFGGAGGATIGGGVLNRILTTGRRGTIGGGESNLVSAAFATIPGGRNNSATGTNALAAGRRAKANHSGSFVWGDSYDGDVSSSASDQFTARASGGVRFFSDTALTSGVTLAAGGGSWASVSDRNVKENIRPVDGAELLRKIAQLNVSRWNYESQDASIEHIGPMAQDFYRLFGVGDNDKTITTVDPDGIALAAIKELSARNAALEARVDELTLLVEQLAGKR